MADNNLTPSEVTGIVAAIYAIGRTIEMGFKKLIAVLTKSSRDHEKERQEDQTAAQFSEIQRELKIQGESHIQTRISLERMGTRQEDILRRVTGVESDVKAIKHKTGRVKH